MTTTTKIISETERSQKSQKMSGPRHQLTKIISETERSQKSQKMSGPRHQLTKNFSRKSEHACFVDTGNKSFYLLLIR